MLRDIHRQSRNRSLLNDTRSGVKGRKKKEQPAQSAAMSPRELAANLLRQGYQDAYMDLARSEDLFLQLRADNDQYYHSAHPGISPYSRPGRRAGLREEMPRAVEAYDKAVCCVRDMMSSASQGNFQNCGADSAVRDLTASLDRNRDALLCLSRLRQRDPYIYTHSVNVSILLAAYALTEGFGPDKIITYGMAGLFHDIGKALLPVALLNANRKLSLTEQTLVMRHPMLGCDLLAPMPEVDAEVILATLEHHERFDGSGYPKGLSGDAISDIGLFTAIADNYDALSSRRPYKKALFPHKTLGILYQLRNTHFNPEMVEKFVCMVGIYPVGTVVELKDGYRGVVTASNHDSPSLPVVTLLLDPQGVGMCPHECDMASEAVDGIARCLAPASSGIEPCDFLGIED